MTLGRRSEGARQPARPLVSSCSGSRPGDAASPLARLPPIAAATLLAAARPRPRQAPGGGRRVSGRQAAGSGCRRRALQAAAPWLLALWWRTARLPGECCDSGRQPVRMGLWGQRAAGAVVFSQVISVDCGRSRPELPFRLPGCTPLISVLHTNPTPHNTAYSPLTAETPAVTRGPPPGCDGARTLPHVVHTISCSLGGCRARVPVLQSGGVVWASVHPSRLRR